MVGEAVKEIEVYVGDHIDRACARLAAAAPAFMTFNGVRLESVPGVTAGDLVARYHAEMNRMAEESAAKRKAFDATPEGQRKLAEAKRAHEEEERRQAEAIAAIDTAWTRRKYPWADGMGEISGFGGGYEAACRTMLYAGLRLVDAADGGDVSDKDLERELLAVEPGCSGAMFGATRFAVRFVQANGWQKYVEQMSRNDRSSK